MGLSITVEAHLAATFGAVHLSIVLELHQARGLWRLDVFLRLLQLCLQLHWVVRATTDDVHAILSE